MKNNQLPNGADAWIDFIIKHGGTVFVDPAPMPNPLVKVLFSIWKHIFRKG